MPIGARGGGDARAARRSAARFAALLAFTGCAGWFRSPGATRWSADLPAPLVSGAEVRVDTIARGVLRRSYVARDVPWAIQLLDVDRRACWRAAAVKGGSGGAVGRARTSELVRQRTASATIAGAVNGDFFLFTPPGLPVGMHVENGRVIAGPADRPVFAVDRRGTPWIGTLRLEGAASSGAESIPLRGWNRYVRDGLAFFDDRFGPALDTASGSLRIVLQSPRGGDVLSVDTSAAATAIPGRGSVLVLGRDAPGELRARLLLLAQARRRFDITPRLMPFHPHDAIGGFPVLVRDSAEVAGLDSAGSATLGPVRHPRTIVATAARGRRLMLIVVDGRQPAHSVGMTLREAAALALMLGATEAINLDGGGSTTMVASTGAALAASHTVTNRPSDAAGERPVANALMIIKGC